jgi:uncharacterized membrane protein YdjX (TVP38/TMEM64 family)
MDPKFWAYALALFFNSIPSLALLVYILDRQNRSETVDPITWLIFAISSGTCLVIVWRLINSGRKPKNEEWYKDL